MMKSILRPLAILTVMLATTLGTDAAQKDSAMGQQIFYRTVKVDGLTIFYREAGPKNFALDTKADQIADLVRSFMNAQK